MLWLAVHPGAEPARPLTSGPSAQQFFKAASVCDNFFKMRSSLILAAGVALVRSQTIVEIAARDPELQTLVFALEAGGLVETLNGCVKRVMLRCLLA